jgi:hypothetical protein
VILCEHDSAGGALIEARQGTASANLASISPSKFWTRKTQALGSGSTRFAEFVIFAELTVFAGRAENFPEDAMLHLPYGARRCSDVEAGQRLNAGLDGRFPGSCTYAQTRRLAFEISKRRERLWPYTQRFGPIGVDPTKH